MTDHDRRPVHYLADELTMVDRLAFESHLDSCDDCLEAVRADGVGRQLVSSLREPLESAVIERLAGQLELVRTAERAKARMALLAAAAVIVLVALSSIVWFGRREPLQAATPVSVVVHMLGDDAESSGRSRSTIQTVTAGGVPVAIADATTRLAMPADSTAVFSQSRDVWLVTRSGINVLCINGDRSVLIASTLDVDRLLAIAIDHHLL